jgi:transcriptional regulator with XRE-family HTH domain
MIDFVQVGNKITKYRKEASLSQEQLADKLFVTRQALSKWENGTASPSIDTLLSLCKIFNVSFEDILCLNTQVKIEVNSRDIFKGYERNYIFTKLLNGEIKVNIQDILSQLSVNERFILLKAIKEKRLKVNKVKLLEKLTTAEAKYLGGK